MWLLDIILKILRMFRRRTSTPRPNPNLTEYPTILGERLANQYSDWIRQRIRKTDLPPISFTMEDRPNTVAYTAGDVIVLCRPYFDDILKKEAEGIIIHEMVHRIQRAPKYEGDFVWMIEGLADFIRLELGYEKAEWLSQKGKDPRKGGGYASGAYFFRWLYIKKRFVYDSFVDSINSGTTINTINNYINEYLRDNRQ